MTVLIVGAGIIGASIAEDLARRGVDVTVIDMRSPGRGASQASAGIIAPYTEAHGDQTMLELGVRSAALFDGFIARVGESSGRAIDYARTGTFEVAFDDEDGSRLRSSYDALCEIGVEVEWIDRDAIAGVEPAVSDLAVAGMVTPSHGWVGVASLITALTHSARLQGAVFESSTEGARIEPVKESVNVCVGDTTRTFDAVVIAAGSWSTKVRIAGVAEVPVRPVRGQLLHLGVTGDAGRAWPARVIWGPRCYTVPWLDGSLLVGATVEDVGFDERSTADGVRGLLNAATELLPGAAAASLDAVRVGLRPASPDGLPIVGPFTRAPKVVMATGHYRNGVLLAPLTAEIVSRYLVSGETDAAIAQTTPERFLS